MIVDTSALVAVIEAEPEALRCIRSILGVSVRRISTGNPLEAYTRIDRSERPRSRQLVDEFIERFELTVEPVTSAQIVIARDAFHRYGKGSGHSAGLNYGDCFAYSLVRQRDELLLFVGDDFGKTDIGIA